MNAENQNKSSLIVTILTLAALCVLVAVYYAPIWWVSLTAPNYPAEAFPDGVRIHFHMNGVFNGCKLIEKDEIHEEEALDCVHEMDTINHYVGMYPIAAGGAVERAFSPFLTTLLGVMLIGFVITKPNTRSAVLGAGFAFLAGWMALAWYGEEGLKYQNPGYISALVTALDQDTEKEKATETEVLSPADALIARLKAEMATTEQKLEEPQVIEEMSGKEDNINHLKATFLRDQQRKPEAERQVWNGSSAQMLSWHYEKSLGRYFNVQEEIQPMVATLTMAGHIVFWGIIAAMVVLAAASRKNGGLFYWLLILVPMALPIFFIIEYSAWLWWYGHSLNQMGAFTVKPFMPTVFGQGKVAQFATHSYPYWGFGLMLLMSALLAVAALIRFKQFKTQ